MSHFTIKLARAGVFATLLAGCIEMAPLLDSSDPDAGSADGGPSSFDSAVELSCYACAFGDQGMCQSEAAACMADPRCKLLTECVTADGCLTRLELSDKTVCSLPCLETLGFRSTTDPALQLAMLLNVCLIDRCRQACGG